MSKASEEHERRRARSTRIMQLLETPLDDERIAEEVGDDCTVQDVRDVRRLTGIKRPR